jgi:ComF family protein
LARQSPSSHCSPIPPKNRATIRPAPSQAGVVQQYWNGLPDCQPNELRRVYGASKSLLHRLFPATCLLCLDPGQPPALDLCRDCEGDFPGNFPACAGCAMPVVSAGESCMSCRRHRRVFDAAFAPYRYEFPLVQLIHRFKYGGQIAIGRILGTLLSRRLAERGKPRVDAIVPVPLHTAREAQRGYNQAREIAMFAAELLRIPMEDRLVRRTRATVEQTALPAGARRRNLRGAFEVRAASVPLRVAILDDVLTTGATAEALALTLKRAGCRHVEIWAVARATGQPADRPATASGSCSG